MTRKELTRLLFDLEERYAVDTWRIGDIYVWPVIKFDLYKRWRDEQNRQYNKALNTAAKKQAGNKLITKLIDATSSVAALLKLQLQQKQHMSIIFSGANMHRVDVEGKFIHRYFEPITAHMKSKHNQKAITIDYQPQDPAKNYKDVYDILFYDKYKYALHLKAMLLYRNEALSLQGFDDFLNEFNAQLPGLVNYALYLKFLTAQVRKIKIAASFFKLVFEKYSPKYVFELCYYNLPMYGLNYAADKMGVVNIDMQHGGQGDLHMAYSHFVKVPQAGFNLLPKKFWCWDEASAVVINKWAVNQNTHKVIVGGNPWLYYNINNVDIDYSYPDKKIVLYTLQLNNPEDYIIDTIKKMDDSYVWWLRMHPRTYPNKDNLKQMIKDNGVAHKVEIDKACEYPLPQILQNSAVHISRSSGSIIEAAQLGVKTLIIDEIGLENFAPYVASGDSIAFLSQNVDEMISLIYSLDCKDIKDKTITNFVPFIDEFLA